MEDIVDQNAGDQKPPIFAEIPKVQKKLPYRWLVLCGVVILLGIGVMAWFSSPATNTPPKIANTATDVTPQNTQIPPQITGTQTPETAIKQTNTLDIHNIPLGDGKYGSTPKVGYIYSCQTTFNGGGASHTGSWIHGNTWDLTEKMQTQGKVSWPEAQFSIATTGNSRVVTGNDLPVDTDTGTFPIASTDPAYQIDRNPNSIKSQTISFSLPLNPTMAANPSCTPMGMIGVTLNGVAIFNGLDAAGRDAVAHEVQDLCSGHPQQEGEYHYHGPSNCLPDEKKDNTLIGYALDGYGIYSMYDANGKEYTDADLDACHGTTSPVLWNGKMVSMYHYVLTQEYPYTIGCFRGSNVISVRPQNDATHETPSRPPPSGMRVLPQQKPPHP